MSIWVLFFAHILVVVNRTFNTTSTVGLQQYTWISAWSVSHDLTLNLNQNLNPKPKPKT